MLDMILSQAVNGLVLGFLYVLIAIGLSIIFGMLGIVNFAHGAFFAVGAYLAYALSKSSAGGRPLLAPVHHWRDRRGRRDGADPASLRQGAAARPDPDLRARAARRSCPAADLRRRASAFLRSKLPGGLRRIRADPADQIPAVRARRDGACAGGLLGVPCLHARTVASFEPDRATRKWSAFSASTCRSSSPASSASAACSPVSAGMLAAPLWTVHAVDGCRRHHAGFRDRDHRRAGLLFRRHHRRPPGRHHHRHDHPVSTRNGRAPPCTS